MKTSRIQIKVPKISQLGYSAVSMGEVFISDGIAYMKLKDIQCVSLASGLVKTLQPGIMVDMAEAELKLSFRDGDA